MAAPPVVLVVEDHRELLNVLSDALQWEGYEVVAASDATQAANVLRTRPIDLLISDPLPFAGGEEALRALEQEFPELPVVTLAEEDSEHDVYFRAWVTIGNRRVLRRPFRLADLLAACREAVGPLDEPDPDEAAEDDA